MTIVYFFFFLHSLVA